MLNKMKSNKIKKEFEILNLGNLNLFRISNLEIRI